MLPQVPGPAAWAGGTQGVRRGVREPSKQFFQHIPWPQNAALKGGCWVSLRPCAVPSGCMGWVLGAQAGPCPQV